MSEAKSFLTGIHDGLLNGRGEFATSRESDERGNGGSALQINFEDRVVRLPHVRRKIIGGGLIDEVFNGSGLGSWGIDGNPEVVEKLVRG